jgi:hypothetical protein
MKKLKISLLALLFTIGIGGAVIQKIHAAPKPLDQVYSWTSQTQGSFTGTRADAIAHYGCENGSTPCADGKAKGVPDSILNQD